MPTGVAGSSSAMTVDDRGGEPLDDSESVSARGAAAAAFFPRNTGGVTVTGTVRPDIDT